ncbi:TetR family transcriptional regulator [Mycobacterium intermedium]|uniref:TetR family transcriptional regulator n=1 Tax=Mycobacterium intermedium TaxID=28445 RepID=A0A1E3S6T6_MYCIE|nr:TetR/AcrR family transcriptional regulator [Mycobacterium intermedium]MCV6962724.1 TetR/AcrR family transcriptional regulator [Mycobacterium intermedium]ODQ97866.1 TetR family transcriptional regulator [Mycobacterium intermedium]OPE48404.1 TetR family transcriptional regulator [Mycobacterium intermedium]ORA96955.1 TetR family transcriptional regulator [Mycobacterium intermedium]
MTARERLIGSAIELLRRHGVAGTGLAELLEHSGTARRSVYVNFPGGKSELMAEATRTAGRLIDPTLADFAADCDGRQSLAAFVEGWKEALRSSEYTAGCPIVAAALGRTESPAAADAAGEVFADWQNALADRLRAQGVGPDDAESLATTIVAAVEGAVVLCLAAKSTEPMDRTVRMLDQLIAQRIRR